MGHAHDADELLEVLGDELGTVVADDAWMDAGELFTGTQDDGLHVAFLHFGADVPVDDEAAEAVERRTAGRESGSAAAREFASKTIQLGSKDG